VQTTIVGWSGSFPGPDSPASCYLIDTGDYRLVLDLGNGAVGALQRYVDLAEIDAICLSHLHADHCIDMISYSVVQNYHPGGRRPPIPVYGPAAAADRLVRAAGDSDPGMTQAFDFYPLSPGELRLGPLRITTAHMNHPVETFGFRIEHGGRALAYSADTGPSEELVGLASGADVLLCEASFLDGFSGPADLHLSARQAAQHGARAGVAELVLTHLVPWNDPAATLEQAAGDFSGPVRLSACGMRLLG
jgi:ribonuclease BN (tRNA processing enzyme)